MRYTPHMLSVHTVHRHSDNSSPTKTVLVWLPPDRPLLPCQTPAPQSIVPAFPPVHCSDLSSQALSYIHHTQSMRYSLPDRHTRSHALPIDVPEASYSAYPSSGASAMPEASPPHFETVSLDPAPAPAQSRMQRSPLPFHLKVSDPAFPRSL